MYQYPFIQTGGKCVTYLCPINIFFSWHSIHLCYRIFLLKQGTFGSWHRTIF
uniref:Uncharacterized protein n=1 Tax=Arundo donax TaxID=35708 RepID=A0A0A9HNC5_ARUDO